MPFILEYHFILSALSPIKRVFNQFTYSSSPPPFICSPRLIEMCYIEIFLCLQGLALIDRDNNSPSIRYFSVDELPEGIEDR